PPARPAQVTSLPPTPPVVVPGSPAKVGASETTTPATVTKPSARTTLAPSLNLHPKPVHETTVVKTPAQPSAPSGPTAREQAEQLYGDGKTLHKKQQLREAEQTFKRCLIVDPTFARCHMMLGSTYALLKDFERGAYHYRKFVEMAPDDSNA